MLNSYRLIAENSARDLANAGDVASIIGLSIVVIGFAITIFTLWRTKRVVIKVREDIAWTDTVQELAAVQAAMEEIKRLHRTKSWELLPERYSALRKSLISIRGANPDLSDGHKMILQKGIQHFAGLERQVERSIMTGEELPNVAKLNNIVSNQLDSIQEVLVEIRKRIGR